MLKTKLPLLLLWMLVAIMVGYFSYPLYRYQKPVLAGTTPAESTAAPVTTTVAGAQDALDGYTPPEGIVIDLIGGGDAGEGVDEDIAWVAETEEEEDSGMGSDDGYYDINSFEPDDTQVQEIAVVKELEEFPLDEEQNRVSAVMKGNRYVGVKTKSRILGDRIEDEREKDVYRKMKEGFTVDDWADPLALQKTISDRMLSRLGKFTQENIWKFLESPTNRRDLAVFQFIQLATPEAIKEATKSAEGQAVITTLSNDLEWLMGLLYSGPNDNFNLVPRNLVACFSGQDELVNDKVARRLASAGAVEFAREKWDRKQLAERFNYYYQSYSQELLNTSFDDLEYWETRFLMGSTQPWAWGSVKNLTWLRNNVRLPNEGYLGAAFQVPYRLRNVAGDSIHGPDYLNAFMEHYDGVLAWAHREVGGVCGALSHYGTFAALANGIPAVTMGEPGHCAYAVRVGNEWVRSNSIYWQHSLHKTFWKEHAWDFLALTQGLYGDFKKTLVSDQLMALGDFLASRRKMHGAFLSYEDALLTQPNNWPALLSYSAYLKEKAPHNKEKWLELHELVNEGLNQRYHNASATLLSKYIYPNLIPLVTDKRELTRLFAAFFKECKTMGSNRWEVNGILSRQLQSFAKGDEQTRFMREALGALIRNPDYAGAAIAWGLSFVAALPDTPETLQTQEDFTDVIVRALGRTRTGNKDRDATWSTINQAMRQAVESKDRKMFQAIGKLSYRKLKKNFPKNKLRFRGYGLVISNTGLIFGDRTMDNNEPVSLHWAALQKDGGMIQIKSNVTVELEMRSEITGVVCITNKPMDTNARPFNIRISDDGMNWSEPIPAETSGQVLSFNLRKNDLSGRFVKLEKEGETQASDFSGQGLIGFYVYGKKIRN